MPDRYTGTPSRDTAAWICAACAATASAWLPITSNGRWARASARAADSIDPFEAAATAARDTCGALLLRLPANRRATWRFR